MRIVAAANTLPAKMENTERRSTEGSRRDSVMCDISVGRDEWSLLQQNLVMSYACEPGNAPDREVDPAAKNQSLSLWPFGLVVGDGGAPRR